MYFFFFCGPILSEQYGGMVHYVRSLFPNWLQWCVKLPVTNFCLHPINFQGKQWLSLSLEFIHDASSMSINLSLSNSTFFSFLVHFRFLCLTLIIWSFIQSILSAKDLNKHPQKKKKKYGLMMVHTKLQKHIPFNMRMISQIIKSVTLIFSFSRESDVNSCTIRFLGGLRK